MSSLDRLAVYGAGNLRSCLSPRDEHRRRRGAARSDPARGDVGGAEHRRRARSAQRPGLRALPGDGAWVEHRVDGANRLRDGSRVDRGRRGARGRGGVGSDRADADGADRAVAQRVRAGRVYADGLGSGSGGRSGGWRLALAVGSRGADRVPGCAPHTWVMQPQRHPAGSLIEGWQAGPRRHRRARGGSSAVETEADPSLRLRPCRHPFSRGQAATKGCQHRLGHATCCCTGALAPSPRSTTRGSCSRRENFRE